ncbi:putative integral membrane protein (TIGR00697 family) [Catalinimonas alkaloidigena]|uniref:queuosine precursor transporter n=1 Tax=Catalinimonas alkaloidigena TaxID=1075417 RepID=UPI0024053F81|nr:queuosine precursor transporter [Catalinimonas alkaloidigena]MDF9794854.1 putative integral membrane protein (TIGR00697 family) [Catalinimonas alkaloidigena]
MTTTNKHKRNILFIVLSGIFLTNALLAELIGVKIFSAEATLGLPPAQIPLLGDFILDFNLTAGAVIWPVVFITTDVINEYFGKRGVKQISYLTVVFIAYSFVVIYLVTELAPASFWLDVNSTDEAGNYFDIDFAFRKIFRQGLGIIIGSLFAFLIGQLLDVIVFQRLRRITGNSKIWLRATGSTLVSQLVDSFVVLFIAFYVFGNWPIAQVFAVGIVNYIYKFTVAVVLTPLLYIAHYLIDNYLGKELAENMMHEATQNTSLD